MNVDREVEGLKAELKRIGDRISWLRKHQKQLESLPAGTFCSHGLDFDNLPHDQVIKVIRTLGGKWNKTKNEYAVAPDREKGQSIDYQTKVDGMDVRCYAGAPPPSCRIVEIEEVVPAHTIPAVPERFVPETTRKVRKMICTGDDPLLVSMSQKLVPLVKPNGE